MLFRTEHRRFGLGEAVPGLKGKRVGVVFGDMGKGFTDRHRYYSDILEAKHIRTLDLSTVADAFTASDQMRAFNKDLDVLIIESHASPRGIHLNKNTFLTGFDLAEIGFSENQGCILLGCEIGQFQTASLNAGTIRKPKLDAGSQPLLYLMSESPIGFVMGHRRSTTDADLEGLFEMLLPSESSVSLQSINSRIGANMRLPSYPQLPGRFHRDETQWGPGFRIFQRQ